MVRLLPCHCESLRNPKIVVSIPQWCDCCPRKSQSRLLSFRFQSHNGAIAADLLDNFLKALVCFNPTMVRLLRNTHPPGVWLPKGFNPTMVRLLRKMEKGLRLGHMRFNPTMVRLLRSVNRVVGVNHFSFNPTMVRLLPFQRREGCCLTCAFQSHNGAIAA